MTTLNDPRIADLYRSANNHNGTQIQVDMAIWQMCYLTKALLKHRQHATQTREHLVIDAIAEVQMIIDQLKIRYCQPGEFAATIKEKQERLAESLGVDLREAQ